MLSIGAYHNMLRHGRCTAAAIRIQTYMRCTFQRKRYKKRLSATIAAAAAKRLSIAVNNILRLVKCLVANNKLKECLCIRKAMMHKSATIIQSMERGRKSRMAYTVMKKKHDRFITATRMFQQLVHCVIAHEIYIEWKQEKIAFEKYRKKALIKLQSRVRTFQRQRRYKQVISRNIFGIRIPYGAYDSSFKSSNSTNTKVSSMFMKSNDDTDTDADADADAEADAATDAAVHVTPSISVSVFHALVHHCLVNLSNVLSLTKSSSFIIKPSSTLSEFEFDPTVVDALRCKIDNNGGKLPLELQLKHTEGNSSLDDVVASNIDQQFNERERGILLLELVKDYLRLLPNPLLLWKNYTEIVQNAPKCELMVDLRTDLAEGKARCMQIDKQFEQSFVYVLQSLGKYRLKMFHVLLKLLSEFGEQYSDINQQHSIHELAAMFCPLLSSPDPRLKLKKKLKKKNPDESSKMKISDSVSNPNDGAFVRAIEYILIWKMIQRKIPEFEGAMSNTSNFDHILSSRYTLECQQRHEMQRLMDSLQNLDKSTLLCKEQLLKHRLSQVAVTPSVQRTSSSSSSGSGSNISELVSIGESSLEESLSPHSKPGKRALVQAQRVIDHLKSCATTLQNAIVAADEEGIISHQSSERRAAVQCVKSIEKDIKLRLKVFNNIQRLISAVDTGIVSTAESNIETLLQDAEVLFIQMGPPDDVCVCDSSLEALKSVYNECRNILQLRGVQREIASGNLTTERSVTSTIEKALNAGLDEGSELYYEAGLAAIELEEKEKLEKHRQISSIMEQLLQSEHEMMNQTIDTSVSDEDIQRSWIQLHCETQKPKDERRRTSTNNNDTFLFSSTVWKVYYFNTLTGETTFEKPTGYQYQKHTDGSININIPPRISNAIKIQSKCRGFLLRKRRQSRRVVTELQDAIEQAVVSRDSELLEEAIEKALSKGIDDESDVYFAAGSLMIELQ